MIDNGFSDKENSKAILGCASFNFIDMWVETQKRFCNICIYSIINYNQDNKKLNHMES